MRRKHEIVNGQHISCWDDPDFFDRYTVVYLDDKVDKTSVGFVGMSENPCHPQFGQHGWIPLSAVQYVGRGGCFKRRIKFSDMPKACQDLVNRETMAMQKGE